MLSNKLFQSTEVQIKDNTSAERSHNEAKLHVHFFSIIKECYPTPPQRKIQSQFKPMGLVL